MPCTDVVVAPASGRIARMAAAWLLGRIGGRRSAQVLGRVLDDADRDVAGAARSAGSRLLARTRTARERFPFVGGSHCSASSKNWSGIKTLESSREDSFDPFARKLKDDLHQRRFERC